ncbi:MAG TPA: fumarylacetoacetate hydrolase family protein [Burkholderiaceae bacterium]|nr:fumarylacetoacetate hydrolase family protein [Burkholderiaceae bacterium]
MRTDWIAGLRRAARTGTAWDVDPATLQCGLDEAYALQAEHLRQLMAETDDEVVGTKLSVTSETALERLGLRAPLTGPILRSRRHSSGTLLARRDFLACVVEAEIGLRLAADLDGEHGVPSRAALLDAIDVAFPAIEVADSRYRRWAEASAPAIVADLAYAGAWVRGADCAGWRTLDLGALPVRLSLDGVPAREGHSSAVLGDPLQALARAVAEAAGHGQVLRAGTVVSTGSCTVPWPLAGGGHLQADFGPLGQVALTLT